MLRLRLRRTAAPGLAWTATDNCAATPAPGNSGTVGGPLTPYWQSWTYDAAGNRASQTDHNPAGNAANDTATTYAYPASGPAAHQPHTLMATTATGPAAAANTAGYTYDQSGNTTGITGGAAGNQTLTWDSQGRLATDTTIAGTTGYVYDTDGNLILRRDPGTTTLLYGDEQLTLNTTTHTVTGTRYYTIGGLTIAALTTTNPVVQYLIPDRQNTHQLTITSNNQTTTRRAYQPFGASRGTPPAAWPGNTGYTTGIPDPTTTLENLGAREYNPATGRFLNPDPLLDPATPQSLNAYGLADNNPTTKSDPTGLATACLDDCGNAIAKLGLNQTITKTDHHNGNSGGVVVVPNGLGPLFTGLQDRDGDITVDHGRVKVIIAPPSLPPPAPQLPPSSRPCRSWVKGWCGIVTAAQLAEPYVAPVLPDYVTAGATVGTTFGPTFGGSLTVTRHGQVYAAPELGYASTDGGSLVVRTGYINVADRPATADQTDSFVRGSSNIYSGYLPIIGGLAGPSAAFTNGDVGHSGAGAWAFEFGLGVGRGQYLAYTYSYSYRMPVNFPLTW